MNSIILIIPYFGKWSLWFEAHLLSIAKNPTLHWLVVTDCEIPKTYPKNITFKPTTLEALNTHVNQVVNANVPLSPRKFCDLKPAYGAIFYDDIKDYDFWGFCDMDIIWGDIRKFMTDDILSNYDVISSRKEAISGHFNLFKNNPSLNNLYKEIPDYQFLFEQPKFMWFDEEKLTNYLKSQIATNQLSFKVKWDTILCNQERGRDSHQEYYLDRWLWQDGKMLNTITHQEVMYLHFINWKRTMKRSEVAYSDQPDSFYISYSKMHYHKHNALQKLWNSFTNLFDGYYVREKRRKLKLKLKSLKKRLKNKAKKHLKKSHYSLLGSNFIPKLIKIKIFEIVFRDSFVYINPKDVKLVLTDNERFLIYKNKSFLAKINPNGIKIYDDEKEYIIKTVSDFLINNKNYRQTIQYEMMIDRIRNNKRPLYGCKNEIEIEYYFLKLKKSFLNIKENGLLTQIELKKRTNNLPSKIGDEIEVFLTSDGKFISSGGSGNHRLCIAKELNIKKIPAVLKGIVSTEDSYSSKNLKDLSFYLKDLLH